MDFVRIRSPVHVGKGFLPAVWSALPTTLLDDLLGKQSNKEGKKTEMQDRVRALLLSLIVAMPEPTLASDSPVISLKVV